MWFSPQAFVVGFRGTAQAIEVKSTQGAEPRRSGAVEAARGCDWSGQQAEPWDFGPFDGSLLLTLLARGRTQQPQLANPFLVWLSYPRKTLGLSVGF